MRYNHIMHRHSFLRVGVFVLALALGLGLFVQDGRAGQVTDKMTAAAGIDMPLPMNSECCDGETDVSTDGCHGECVCCSTILQVNPVPTAIETATLGVLSRPVHTDHTDSPDPYPPKPPFLA